MVDPISKKAAELLVEELSDVDNNVSETLQPLLSDAQQLLKVPPHLIYICGLVMEVCHCEAAPAGSNPTKTTLSKSIFSTNPTVAMELFESWQQCYNHGMERKQNQGRHQYSFCPSPILVPSHMVQLYIRQELQQAHCRLAQQAMNELLEEEKAIREKLKPKQKLSKPAQHQRSSSESTFPTQSRTTETLEELLKPPVVHLNQSSSWNEGEWTKVGKAKSEARYSEDLPFPRAKERRGDKTIKSQTNSPTNGSKRVTSWEQKSYKSPERTQGGRGRSPGSQFEDPLNVPTKTTTTTTTAAPKPTLPQTSSPKSVVTPSDNEKGANRREDSRSVSPSSTIQAATTTRVPSPASPQTSLEKKLEQLEQQLEQERQDHARAIQRERERTEERWQQLEQERKEHARAMQMERERTEERCQALQLRLYISETRLKTFQDALRGHVEAVTNNMAMSDTDPAVLRFSNENRDKTNNTADPLSSKNNTISPLLSRVSSRKEVNQEKELQ